MRKVVVIEFFAKAVLPGAVDAEIRDHLRLPQLASDLGLTLQQVNPFEFPIRNTGIRPLRLLRKTGRRIQQRPKEDQLTAHYFLPCVLG